jgi:mono/diheme cytochrome c family protein
MLIAAVALLSSIVLADDAGKALYDKKCALCHGKDGVAKKMAAGSGNFNDAEWQKANSAEAISKVTAEGKGEKMKPFAEKLSAEEIASISAYIKTLG